MKDNRHPKYNQYHHNSELRLATSASAHIENKQEDLRYYKERIRGHIIRVGN